MKEFYSTFSVRASLASVLEFHASTTALKRLSPPPIWVQIHHADPLAEGSISIFTLWFLFIPLRWKARHEDVSQHGFSDLQIRGPLTYWRHQHHFEELTPGIISIHDSVQYQLPDGWKGLLLSLLFNPIGLRLLFTYRSLATRLVIQ